MKSKTSMELQRSNLKTERRSTAAARAILSFENSSFDIVSGSGIRASDFARRRRINGRRRARPREPAQACGPRTHQDWLKLLKMVCRSVETAEYRARPCRWAGAVRREEVGKKFLGGRAPTYWACLSGSPRDSRQFGRRTETTQQKKLKLGFFSLRAYLIMV